MKETKIATNREPGAFDNSEATPGKPQWQTPDFTEVDYETVTFSSGTYSPYWDGSGYS